MRLTFKSLSDAQRPSEGLAPLAFAFTASVAAILLTNRLGRMHRTRYGVYIRDFTPPARTVYKLPGIYIQKEDEQDEE